MVDEPSSLPSTGQPVCAPARAWQTAHRVDYKISVRFLKRGYYLRLMAGPERRSRERLAAERQVSLVGFLALVAVFIWSLTSFVLFVVLSVAYLVKSFLGVDLWPDESIFHSLFFN